MPPCGGISQRNSSICRSSMDHPSDVEDEARPPPAVALAHGQLVVGDALDLRGEAMAGAVDALSASPATDGALRDRLHAELAERDLVGLQADEEGLQPVP